MKRLLLLIGLLAFVATPAYAAGEVSAVDACRDDLYDALAREQRLYRSVLYGQPTASGARIGSVRYDVSGTPWIKMTADDWRTPGNKDSRPNRDWGDELEPEPTTTLGELPPRRGLFSLRRTTTSELIPYLLQSTRALQCRTQSVCGVARESLSKKQDAPPEVVTVNVPGCVAYQANTFDACQFAGGTANAAVGDVLSTCDQLALDLLQREQDLLRVAVEYDAAYRSLLQFAGSFDVLLQELKWPFEFSFRQVLSVIGEFARVPCFIGSCDDSPLKEAP